MKDKHETLSDTGIQKSTLRNFHNTGGGGFAVVQCCSIQWHKYQKHGNGNNQVIFAPRMQHSCECFKDIMPSHFLAVSVFLYQIKYS